MTIKPQNKIVCTIGLNKYNRLSVQWPPKKVTNGIKQPVNKNVCTNGLNKYNRLSVQWPPKQSIAGIKKSM